MTSMAASFASASSLATAAAPLAILSLEAPAVPAALLCWFVGEEEPVAVFQGLELAAYDACEGGSDVPAGEGRLGQPGGEEVDVARRLVQRGQLGPQRGRDLRGRGTPRARLGQAARFPELVVAGQPVVADPLDV